MIKEFFGQEVKMWRGEAERERKRRREAERMVERMGEEIRRVQGVNERKEGSI